MSRWTIAAGPACVHGLRRRCRAGRAGLPGCRCPHSRLHVAWPSPLGPRTGGVESPSIAQRAGASEPCLHARRYGDDAIQFSRPRSS